jgi:flagellar hook assembly protein FlgD
MQQRHAPQRQLRRRHITQGEQSSGTLVTALSVSTVILLLTVTFFAEWLRTPQLNLSITNTLISPNGDQDRDSATLSYDLSEEARVSVDVYTQQNTLVRTLVADQLQPAGQSFVVWDGASQAGQRVEDGVYRLQVTARGPLRSASRSQSVEIDTAAPALQLANLPNGLRLGTPILNVQGLTEPGVSVWINDDPAPLVVDSQGQFTVQRKLADGVNTLVVRAVDAAGNVSSLSREVTLVTAPPEILVETPAEGAWSAQPLVTVRGQAPAQTTLTINDQPVAVRPDGSFEYQVLLQDGENIIRLLAADDVGNTTSLERLVHIKTRPPSLTLSVAEGQRLNNAFLQLAGSTDPGAVVTVNRRVIPVGPNGNFQTNLSLLEGENLVEITARDQAGNLTTINRRVFYEIPAPADELTRLARNLASLPSYTLPVLLGVPLILFLILLSRQRPIALKLSVDQQSFTPGLPGEARLLIIYLELSRSASLDLEVLDGYGQVQATLLNNRRRSGGRQHRFFWDGLNDLGQPVQPGEYVIQAVARAFPSRVISAVNVQVDTSRTIVAGQAAQRLRTLNTPASAARRPPAEYQPSRDAGEEASRRVRSNKPPP